MDRYLQKVMVITAFACAACGVASLSRAVDIVDEQKDAARVTSENGIYTIQLPQGQSYTLTEIPTEATQPKTFTVIPADFDKPKYRDVIAKMSLGDELTHDDAVAVLDAYLREVAFDYDSVKLRKLQVGARQYVAWCSNYAFTCLDWQIRAGTWIEYEMNGKNRSGGMSGFERKVVVVRKVKAVEVSSGAPPPIKPGMVVVSDITKAPHDALQVARRVLESDGYTFPSANDSDLTITSAPNHGLLTTKNADCGRSFGIPYLMDKRAATDLSITVSVSPGKLELGSIVAGIYRVDPPEALKCVSKGVLENDLLQQIKAQL